ncbi:flagellar biosynthesis protein FlhB [Bacillus sp. HMSC76G11]|uniref:Flagellar biosynthetic protein FlhB n=1 Tax=Metabacillus idriensis TaxID=324768 RepID=A0A6I2M8I2_9BACI|nr:flagellar biosynthesis protein FlhB [Metabacillus idriensis]MRX53684.1 flagellar biosynthesis protein FlhB [Metabacillus idriensis]OHR64877.1 flagellar biosynthesis protein FlhB [Bacillus sp. HMSC76G11]
MEFLKLDLQFFSGEKTEKATPRKRDDVRKKGQVAKSADVNTAISLLAIFLSLLFIGPFMFERIMTMMNASLQETILMNLTEKNVHELMVEMVIESAYISAPIMAVALVAGVAGNYMQVGFLFSTEAIQMKLEKINPIQGFKRIYSLRAIVELLKSILKISFVGAVTFSVIWFQMAEILSLSKLTVEKAFIFIAKLTFQMGLFASIALLFLSLLDYFYQKFDFEKNIRMSKQDLKDEYKKSEGDPLIKSRIKQKQREMAARRMMQEVPNADVVITNPTHFAIALKYDEDKMDAPFVVAKGVDFVAQKIKETAKANEVTMVENRPLARALYDQVEIGKAVPEEFFKAIAEILAYVYQLKNKI